VGLARGADGGVQDGDSEEVIIDLFCGLRF